MYYVNDNAWLAEDIENFCEILSTITEEVYSQSYKKIIEDMITLSNLKVDMEDAYEHLTILAPYLKEFCEDNHDSLDGTTFDDMIRNAIDYYIFNYIESKLQVIACNFVNSKTAKNLKIADMPQVTVDTTPQQLLNKFKEKPKNMAVYGLSTYLGMSVGTKFTVDGISGVYTLTDDGITYDGYLISQQQLLYIMFGACEIHSK